jgi:hypothetical protein
MTTYQSEIAFLNRKLPTEKIKWEVIAAMGQIVTPIIPESDANAIFKNYKNVFGLKAGFSFNKMFMVMPNKLKPGFARLVVVVEVLRDIFGGEIDSGGGGGGRGYNPLSTRPGQKSGV